MANISWLECKKEYFLLLLVVSGLSIVPPASCQYCNTRVGEPLIKISSTLSSNKLPIGATINLTCTAWQTDELAMKNPKTRPLRIEWFDPQDKRVGDECQAGSPADTLMRCTLMVGVLTEGKFGNYTCKASNGYNYCSNARFQVGFQGTQNPEIGEVPVNQSVLIGSTVKFNCTATGHPQPTITWTKNNDSYSVQSNPRAKVIADEGKSVSHLVITRVKSDDYGKYQCVANNSAGVKTSRAAFLLPGTVASKVTVHCENQYMTVVVSRSLLPGVDGGHVRLLNASCTATETSTHFSVRTQLDDCLTSTSYTPKSVLYSNKVLAIPSDIKDVVTRKKEVEIPFSCQYSKSGVVSSAGWKPENNVIVVNVKGRGNFTMTLDMFPDSDFATPYCQSDMPVAVQVQQPLFFEVSVTTGDSQLSIRTDHCYATPTQERNASVEYNFIQNGCPTDPSVRFLPTNSTSAQRFILDAFQFTGEYPFVFVHCHVTICNGNELSSECKKICSSYNGGLRKREVRDHLIDEYSLVQGPVYLVSKKQDVDKAELSSKNGSSLAFMVVLAFVCVICLTATILVVARKSRSISLADFKSTAAVP